MNKKSIFLKTILIFFILIAIIYITSKENKYNLFKSNKKINEQTQYTLEIIENSNTHLVYEVFNKTEDMVYFGVDYEIEKYEDKEWKSFGLELSFIEMAIGCMPNSNYRDDIDYSNTYGILPNGRYRLIKTIGEQVLSAEFDIK